VTIRIFLKRFALWVALPATIVVLSLVAWLRLGAPYMLRPVGGAWYLGSNIPFDIIEAGTRFRSLYRKDGRSYVQVDRMVGTAQYYRSGCVVYEAVHTYRGPIFAVCGDRTPVRIIDGGDNWSIQPEGLISPETRRRQGTYEFVGPLVLKPIEAIITLALQQPPYAADWAKRDSVAWMPDLFPNGELRNYPTHKDPVATVIRQR
jgi:hypothetical protein